MRGKVRRGRSPALMWLTLLGAKLRPAYQQDFESEEQKELRRLEAVVNQLAAELTVDMVRHEIVYKIFE